MSNAKLTDKEIERELLRGQYHTLLHDNKISAIILAMLTIFGSALFLFIGRSARGVSLLPVFVPIAVTSVLVLLVTRAHHTIPSEKWQDMTPNQRATWIIYHSKWGFLNMSALMFHASIVICWGAIELALSRNLLWTAMLFGGSYLLWVLYCTIRSRWIVRVALEGPEEHRLAYRLVYFGLLIVGGIHIFRGLLHILIINAPTVANLLVLPLLLAVYIIAMIAYPFALTLAWRARIQWKHWEQLEDRLNED